MGELFSLVGKTALVTGGSMGVGYGCARELLRAGAKVTIVARRENMLRTAAEELAREVPQGAGVRWLRCDVTVEDDVARAVSAICEADGRLDIAVANAGTGIPVSILEGTVQEWQFVLNLNVVGVALTIKHAARAMKDAGGGSIIAISSVASKRVMRYFVPYSVSKASLDMLVRCAADELGRFGIRVNAIQPGLIDTGNTKILPEEVRAEFVSHTPLGRLGLPEEVGRAVCFLASDRASWITGQIFAVDGGLTVPRGEDLGPLMRRLKGVSPL